MFYRLENQLINQIFDSDFIQLQIFTNELLGVGEVFFLVDYFLKIESWPKEKTNVTTSTKEKTLRYLLITEQGLINEEIHYTPKN